MPRSKIAERVINYLACCGNQKVAMQDLFAAVIDDYREGMDADMIYGTVKAVLEALADNDLVSLSLETISSAKSIPIREKQMADTRQRRYRILFAVLNKRGTGYTRTKSGSWRWVYFSSSCCRMKRYMMPAMTHSAPM